MSLARPNNRGTQNSACLEKLRPIAEATGRLDSEYTGRLGPLYLFKNTVEKRVMFLGTFPFVPETRCLAHVRSLHIHRIVLVSSPVPHQSSLHPQNKQGICFPIFSASSSFCEDGICRKRFWRMTDPEAVLTRSLRQQKKKKKSEWGAVKIEK